MNELPSKLWLTTVCLIVMMNGFLHAEAIKIDGLSIRADVIYTDEGGGNIIRVIASGNVHISFKETDAEADFLEFKVEKNLVELRGNINVTHGDSTITSKTNAINRSKKVVWDLNTGGIELGPIVPIVMIEVEDSDP